MSNNNKKKKNRNIVHIKKITEYTQQQTHNKSYCYLNNGLRVKEKGG